MKINGIEFSQYHSIQSLELAIDRIVSAITTDDTFSIRGSLMKNDILHHMLTRTQIQFFVLCNQKSESSEEVFNLAKMKYLFRYPNKHAVHSSIGSLIKNKINLIDTKLKLNVFPFTVFHLATDENSDIPFLNTLICVSEADSYYGWCDPNDPYLGYVPTPELIGELNE